MRIGLHLWPERMNREKTWVRIVTPNNIDEIADYDESCSFLDLPADSRILC